MTLLVVCAVEAERDAIGATSAEVIVGGVGPVEAAAATAARLTHGGVDLVIGAGIGGGFAPLTHGDIAVASSIVFADLGAETADGFVPLPSLGFGRVAYEVPPALAVQLADRTGGHLGTVLTVATVTGTAATADALAERYPDAVAEGMEGAGVAAAAARFGVPCAELRAVSNPVGPRDRDAWRIPQALTALAAAIASVADWMP
ncbi:MAG: futalosine hydrolase [Jatrophihabitans sp.]|uniref:futalosine hydrolase n=1 Tax=Jatrophihabitans sp. TaxID=1932789 RepID=UPI003F7EE801